MSVETPEPQACLRGWKSRVDRMAADTKATSERLAALRARGTDDNDLVEVTIDSSGALIGIHFTDRVQRLDPAAAERAVMSALRVARSTAAARAHEIIAEILGADSVAGRTIAARVTRQLSDDRPASGR